MTELARTPESGSGASSTAASTTGSTAGATTGSVTSGTATATLPPPAPPPLAATAGITTFGHLAWIGWVWLTVGVIFAAVVVTVGAVPDGRLSESLWEGTAAGWQPWLLLGAGVSTTSTFAPMLIGNGVTRARLSASVTVTLVALAVAGSVVITTGYLVEGLVFRANDWTHVLNGDDRTIAGAMLAGLALQHALTLAAYFAAGWLIGIGFYRFDRNTAIVRILPSMLPAVLVELLLLDGGAGVASAPLDGPSGPHLALGAPAAVAVIAAATVAASRATRDLALTE